jgi:hypothetical protein
MFYHDCPAMILCDVELAHLSESGIRANKAALPVNGQFYK